MTFTTIGFSLNGGFEQVWNVLSGSSDDQETLIVVSLIGISAFGIVLTTVISLICILRLIMRNKRRRKTRNKAQVTRAADSPPSIRSMGTTGSIRSMGTTGSNSKFTVNLDGEPYEYDTSYES